MAYELRDNSGSIFGNRNKEHAKHPDMTGDCKIDGKEYRVSAWQKTTRKGDTYYSLSFTPKSEFKGYERERKAKPAQPKPQVDAGFQDEFPPDIPF